VAASLAAAVAVLDAQGPIKIATIAPDRSPYVNALREMADAWRKRTNGRVTATVFPGGDNTESGMLRDMQPAFNRLHGAQLSAITLGALDDAFNVFGLPMFFESYAEADRALEKLRPELERRLEAKGYQALNFAYVGWIHVFSKEPIKTVDDLKRQKLYTSTGDDRMVKWYSANGFRAVPLDTTSMITSLKTDMIQALPSPPLYAQLLTWYKSAPYMLDIGMAPLIGSTVISRARWSKISPDDQAIVAEEAVKAGDRLRREVPRLDKEAIEAMKKTGLTVTTANVAEWRKTAEQLGEAMRKAGLVPGDIYDIAKRERDSVRAGR
jgi:TRAP-type C4-dicarboxylate transport system substrate-binding protein